GVEVESAAGALAAYHVTAPEPEAGAGTAAALLALSGLGSGARRRRVDPRHALLAARRPSAASTAAASDAFPGSGTVCASGMPASAAESLPRQASGG
ncbi:MAG TPA: hypothetical protein VLC53_00640, partial [Myxococcota bacterium]|nr:hypothetical protein [Myxococcota bacterium]